MYWPDHLYRMFLTRCPRVIPVLWTIINTFVEERTREKFAILKTDELIEYIDEINIPDFLGGQMQVRVGGKTFLLRSHTPSVFSFKLHQVVLYHVRSIYAKMSLISSMRKTHCSVIMPTKSFHSRRAVPMRFVSVKNTLDQRRREYLCCLGFNPSFTERRTALVWFWFAQIWMYIYYLSYWKNQIFRPCWRWRRKSSTSIITNAKE